MPSKNTTAKKAPKQIAPVVSDEIPAVKQAPLKLDDSVLIQVKSNVFGELIYINARTGDRTTWSGCGDVQILSVGDLRAMKGSQRVFFENQWVYLVGIEDAGFEEVSVEDLYKALLLSQYYRSLVNPDNYTEIFSYDLAKRREVIMSMSSASKMNLIVAANTCIADGTLDSLKKIKLLEECLGCELDKP